MDTSHRWWNKHSLLDCKPIQTKTKTISTMTCIRIYTIFNATQRVIQFVERKRSNENLISHLTWCCTLYAVRRILYAPIRNKHKVHERDADRVAVSLGFGGRDLLTSGLYTSIVAVWQYASKCFEIISFGAISLWLQLQTVSAIG